MGRAPCCDKANVKRGPWSPEEDTKLKEFIGKYGTGGNWIALPQKAGLRRCGKSCRLRWLNYLRPNIKHGDFSEEEDRIICTLYAAIGSRWSIIAAQLQGRTDNDIKNYWNTKLKKKLMGIHTSYNQASHRRPSSPFTSYHQIPSQQAQSQSSLSHLFQNCSPFHTEAKSLTTLESMALLSPTLYNSNNCVSLAEDHYFDSCFQSQEGLMMNIEQNYPLKDSFLIFGGNNNEGSCSSSDGSCSQMNYGNKEIKQESMNPFQGYISNGGFHEANEQKMVNLDYGSTNGNCLDNSWKQGEGVLGSPQYQLLQNDLMDVKQLRSSSSNDNSFTLNEGNKTHERTMYY